jgi:ABC-type phosphate/phosphonate transport system substrate-binding protein
VAANTGQLIELLEQGQIDFYLESAFPTYIINRTGTAKLLLRRWKSGVSEYRGVIFTSKQTRITRLEDLRGKMIAFEDPGSTSGYFLPKLLLFEKRFRVAEKPDLSTKVSGGEIGYIFAGSAKNVVKLVREEKVAAGAISNVDYASLDETSKARLSMLAESGSVPRHLVSVRRNLPEAVIKRLKEILLSMDQDDEGQKILDKLTVRQNSTRCLEARKHFVASSMICITSGAKKIAVLKLTSTSIKSGTIRRIGGRVKSFTLDFLAFCFSFFPHRHF